MSSQTTVVLGAGGPTGLECVKQLVADGVTVRAVVRSPDKYKGVFPDSPKVEVVKGDVTDEESLKVAFGDAGRVIFAASAAAYFAAKEVDNEAVGRVAKVAKELGMERVLLISSGLVTKKNRFNVMRAILNRMRWHLMDHKFEGEEKLRNSGVPFTVVRPVSLTNEERGQSDIVLAQGDSYPSLRKLVGLTVCRADVAAVCVAAIKNPGCKNKTFELMTTKAKEFPPLEEQLKTVFDGLKDGMHM